MSQIIIKMPDGEKELRIHAVPEQAWELPVVRMVRVKNRVVIVGKDGMLYSPQSHRNYCSITNWWESQDLLLCLYRLKLLPVGSVTRAKKLREAEEKRFQHDRAVGDLRGACRKLGVKITRAMERSMKAKK